MGEGVLDWGQGRREHLARGQEGQGAGELAAGRRGAGVAVHEGHDGGGLDSIQQDPGATEGVRQGAWSGDWRGAGRGGWGGVGVGGR